MKQLLLFLFLISGQLLQAQNELLASGPMLGYNELREVMVWVQTTESALVAMEYWEKGQEDKIMKSNMVRTEKEKGFTAHLLADHVLPGRSYDYRIMINTEFIERNYPLEFTVQSDWLFHQEPPDFSIAVGSCAYINEEPYDRNGEPYGGEYQIFESIADKDPTLMFWLGDNTYFRPADWTSRTGMLHRHSHTRALPEMQELLAIAHHYAIWDDHDFGPNDSDRSFSRKKMAQEAFESFWANPYYGINGEGVTSNFSFNDVDVFMLDNRYFRTPNDAEGGEITMLGKTQLEWFIENLINSKARFKLVMIGGQVVSPAEKYENFANRHGEERTYLLSRIEEEKIRGVVFLSGDRHHTEFSMYENAAGKKVYDLTSSPLTAGSTARNKDEGNIHRVEGTFVGERNFALLEFTGKARERIMTIRLFNTDGKELWTRQIDSRDL